jgi:ATP phosphoribosyltransferase
VSFPAPTLRPRTAPRARSETQLRLALPKGRIQAGVLRLLDEAGIEVSAGARNYRPSVSLPEVEAKVLKPQNVVEMLGAGSRDLGFAGADWVAELGADIVEILDTGLDPVRLVLAAPRELLVEGGLPAGSLVVASEYERLTRAAFARRGEPFRFVRSYGATEVFPPEDADCIVDNTATGSTLSANGLQIVDVLLESSTRLYASQAAWDDPRKRPRLENWVTVLEAVLSARRRVLLEVNVSAENLEAVVSLLPSMRRPTVAPLFGDGGYAVKAAVPRRQVPELIPRLRAAGGSDVLVSSIQQIVV